MTDSIPVISIPNDGASIWRDSPPKPPRREPSIRHGTTSPSSVIPVPPMMDTPLGRFLPEIDVDVQLPPWQQPGYMSTPVHKDFTCNSVPWYVAWSTCHTYEVPSDRMLVVTGICFEWGDSLPIGDVFEFTVIDAGIEQARFQSMRVADGTTVPNPAYQYAIGGPQRPIPMQFGVRPGHTIIIRARNLGQQAIDGTFSATDADPFGVGVTTNILGWTTPVIPGREIPRTSDVFQDPVQL
jgi:hypothetical protein